VVHDKGSLLLLGFKVKLLLNSVTLCTLTIDVGTEFSITDTLQIMLYYFVWKNNVMDKPVLVFYLAVSFALSYLQGLRKKNDFKHYWRKAS